MHKSMAIFAAATAVAAALWAPVAEARGGGGNRGGGSGMRMGHHNHHHHHFRFRRDSFASPVYKAPEKLVKPAKLVAPPQAPLVKSADGKGRVYDPTAKAWCDGSNHCWTGKYAWTFKDGAWFYGSYRWSEVKGVWSTNAPEAPTAVDCDTVPAFAAVKPTTAQESVRRDPGGTYASQTPAPAKAAAGGPAKAGECKKYFPSVGELLPVPCEG